MLGLKLLTGGDIYLAYNLALTNGIMCNRIDKAIIGLS